MGAARKRRAAETRRGLEKRYSYVALLGAMREELGQG